MKKMKKLVALLIAAAMVLTMSMSVFAEVPTSQTIQDGNAADADGNYTISVGSSDTHTYTVYQILTGTLVAGENKLGNPAWGLDAKGGDADINAFITSITETGLSNVQINDLVKAQLKDGAAGRGIVDKDHTLDVAPGYYLIVDTTASLDDKDAKSLNIVAVFNDIEQENLTKLTKERASRQ